MFIDPISDCKSQRLLFQVSRSDMTVLGNLVEFDGPKNIITVNIVFGNEYGRFAAPDRIQVDVVYLI